MDMVIGYIDEDKKTIARFAKTFARRGFDINPYDGDPTIESIKNWVVTNRITCLIVDYMLDSHGFNFDGHDVVRYFNDYLPDFNCVILTNEPGDSEEEQEVLSFLIIGKNELNYDGGIDNAIKRIKNASDVFIKKMFNNKEEYRELFGKRKSEGLSDIEEKRFLDLYKRLKNYAEVDELDEEFLKSDISKKMDLLIEKMEEFTTKEQ